jgi:hypothetical protein
MYSDQEEGAMHPSLSVEICGKSAGAVKFGLN